MTYRERLTPLLSVSVSVTLGLFLASPAWAEDDENDEAPSAFAPGWLELAGVDGKGVIHDDDGSKSKFREDYNVQSGADIRLQLEHGAPGESQFSLRGFGQTGEKQGYLVGEHDSERFDLTLDLQAWTEYYNRRDGSTSRPNRNPFTNDGEDFYGDGIPSTDWFTVGGDADVSIGSLFHKGYGDFHYRDVNGDQTTLKSGSTDGVPSGIGGPGSVIFDYPGRKKVDYDAYMGLIGGTSGFGGINWQTNVVYQYHDNQSKLTEPIFDSTSVQEVDRWDEDSEVHMVRYDLSGGRHLSPDVYVFGAGFVSYERADPEPELQITESGSTFTARRTSSSKVTRWTPAMTLGSVFTPTHGLVVSADTSVRGYIQEGDLDEDRRDDLLSPPGDFGTAISDVDRDSVVSTTRLTADWKVARRWRVKGELRYQYRWEDVDSTQDFAFSPAADPSEIEKFDSDHHRAKAGASARYRMTQGRYIEAGYQFSYTDVSRDIDRVQNQFILGEYDSQKHRAHLKAAGRLTKKLRGELRAQYVYEERDMDEATTEPQIGPLENGTTETKYWRVSPVLYWIPSKDWSIYGNYSISRLEIEPEDGNAFDYDVLTNSVTAGVTFNATERLSASGSYTAYVNDDDVENVGHNANLTGRFDLDKNWSMNGGYRYLGYDVDSSSLDDYDVHVLSLGVTGKF